MTRERRFWVGWAGSRRDGDKVHFVRDRGGRTSQSFRGSGAEARAQRLADRMNADYDRYESAMWGTRDARRLQECSG